MVHAVVMLSRPHGVRRCGIMYSKEQMARGGIHPGEGLRDLEGEAKGLFAWGRSWEGERMHWGDRTRFQKDLGC